MEIYTKNKKTSFFALFSLLLLLLLSFNGASIFSINIPSPEKVAGDSRNLLSVSSSSSNLMYSVKEETPPVISKTHLKLQLHSPEKEASGARDSRNLISVSSFMHAVQQHQVSAVKEETPPVISKTHLKLQIHSPGKEASGAGESRNVIFVPSLMHEVPQQHQDFSSVKEETPPVISNTHLPFLRKSHSLLLDYDNFSSKNKKLLELLTFWGPTRRRRTGNFPTRVKAFFSKNETFSCKVRFFMTWFSSLDSFSDREFHSIEALFKSHPNGCLLIVSNSMDSTKGTQILKPFSDKGFRITAISPDLNYLLKNTMAESWFLGLIKGTVDAGDVPLGQNLSNLLRLCLLYKFGGVYIDTDVIVLKSFSKLKNTIGAQTLNLDSRNWSRLNNAVMVFDKMHPLLYKFIEEFSLTFNGNKWGHNGPYLVSRVVSRLQGSPGYKFTVLPPPAFYPVNWDKVHNLFCDPESEMDSKWMRGKLRLIRSESYAVHLWNKQSKGLHIEKGSILKKILLDHCVFCNSSANGIVSSQ